MNFAGFFCEIFIILRDFSEDSEPSHGRPLGINAIKMDANICSDLICYKLLLEA